MIWIYIMYTCSYSKFGKAPSCLSINKIKQLVFTFGKAPSCLSINKIKPLVFTLTNLFISLVSDKLAPISEWTLQEESYGFYLTVSFAVFILVFVIRKTAKNISSKGNQYHVIHFLNIWKFSRIPNVFFRW